MPDRIEDMSPLPQSPRKGNQKFDYDQNGKNEKFQINLNQ